MPLSKRFSFFHGQNLLVFSLCIIIAFAIILPVIKGGNRSVFYSIDPDSMYSASILLYIKKGFIIYDGHPGTPAIVFLAFTLTPLRLLAKFVASTPFIDWVFNNYSSVFMYLRIWQSILLFGSLLIIALSMSKLVNKILPIFTVFVMLLLFNPFYYLGSTISAESFSFFMVSIWLFILVYQIFNDDLVSLFFLTLFAGLAFAARATNLFLLPATLVAVLYYKSTIKTKLILLLFSLVNIIAGFVIGVSPIKQGPISVLKSVWGYSSTTGVEGGGQHIFFSLPVYISSAMSYFTSNTFATISFLLFSATSLIAFFLIKEKIFKEIALISLIFSAGALIFAKYPLAHYETANYLVIVFFGSALLYKLCYKFNLILIILSIFLIVPVFRGYYADISKQQENTVYLESFVRNNPANVATLWEWAKTEDFVYLWTRNYSGGIFDDRLSVLNPKIYQLVYLKDVRISINEDENISDVCWDEMYIQKSSLETFLNINPVMNLSVKEIPGEDMYFVKSNHCSVAKP